MTSASQLILCIGDLDVDVMVRVDRLPTRDSKVNGTPLQRVPGGMAGNVAMAISRLGGHARVLGRVGNDADGAFALAGLEAAGIDTRNVVRLETADTFVCIALITPDGEKSLVKMITDAYLPELPDIGSRAFEGVRHAHLTFGRDPAISGHVVASAHGVGATCSLDMERADLPADAAGIRGALEGFDILFCNSEARAAMDGILGTSVAMIVPDVVTTLGEAGARVESRGTVIEVAGQRVHPKDTTGAGDCFAAACLFARLVLEHDWDPALRFANCAAGLSTQGLGAQSALPTRSDIERMLSR